MSECGEVYAEYIAELERADLVQRIERRASHGGKQTNIYDLSGLVKRLKDLEPEFRAVEEEAKAGRQAVTKRGHSRGLKARSISHGPAEKS